MPQIKKKRDLHYRAVRKYTNKGTCLTCANAQLLTIFKTDGTKKGKEQRCTVIGLNNSNKFRIHPNCVCDAHRVI